MPPAPTKYTDLISSSVMTFMIFYASIYLQAKVTIIFGSLAEYLGFFLMFVSARHIFVAQDRRQTAECPDTDGDKRILKRQGLIGTQRHVFSKNSPYACQRTREQTQANLGADAVVSGSRDKRVWEQRRTCLGADASASAPRFADGHRESEKRHGSTGSGLQRGKNGLGPRK